MLKRFIYLIMAAILLMPMASCASKYDTGADVSILIATDLHYISPSLTENEDLFRVAVDNADGKVSHYSEEIVDAFVDEVISRAPEVLILSGDLTFNGATKSHEDLVKKLKKISDAGIAVLTQPGNHDVNSTQAFTFSGEELAYTEALSASRFCELYADLGPNSAMSVDEHSFSYSYQTSGNLRIIMLDANSEVKGAVSDKTLEWLESELKRAKKDKVDVITVSHQNLYAHSPLLSFGYQLYNAAKVEELLFEYGVKCHLSGHIHVQSVLENAESEITEIVTSSLPRGNIQYGSVTYSKGELSYTSEVLDVAAWAEKAGSDNPDLLGFGEYVVDYFKKNCYRQVQGAFAESDVTDGELKLLAETFAEINFAYFMGETVSSSDHESGIKLWHELGASFFAGYIDSMMSVMGVERRAVTVKLS